MTSIKVSQLPNVELLAVTDELIVNDTSKTPTATGKATIGEVLTFAQTVIDLNTSQISLVTPQGYTKGKYSASQVVSDRGRVGVDGGVLPPIPPGGLSTQEDLNIFNLFSLDALDNAILDINTNGAGVTAVTAGTGITSSPAGGITTTGSLAIDPLVVVTISDNQIITGRKTYTDISTFNQKIFANQAITITGDSTLTGSLTVSANVTATQFIGDGSQLTGIVAGGSVTSVVPGDGLLQGATTGTGNTTPITTTGTLSVDNTVVRTTGDQSISGVKTFTAAPDMDGGINVGGNITPTASITIGNSNTSYLGDASQLTGIPDSGITSLTPSDGLMSGATSGTPNNTPISSAGSISVDNTVVRTTGDTILGTAQSAANLTVNGNITIPTGEGVFTGDGSGLTNITAVAGPFTFMGEVDAVNGSPPTNPTPDDAFIYFNTVAGNVNANWAPIPAGTPIGLDQMLVYSGGLSGWVMGSAVDRGTFLPVQGGTILNNLTVNGIITGVGQANFSANVGVTGTVTASGFFGPLTGNVTGNVTGNADTATNATTAATATAVTLTAASGTNDFFLTISGGATGSQAILTDSNLIYNASTNTFGAENISAQTIASSTTIQATGNITTTAGVFVGDLNGNATTATSATTANTATTATSAENVKLTLDNVTQANYLTFSPVTGGSGSNNALAYDSNLVYNAASDTLSVGTLTAVTEVEAGTITGTILVTGAAASFTGACSANNITATATVSGATGSFTDLTTTGVVTLATAGVTGELTAGSADIGGTLEVTGAVTGQKGAIFSGGNVEVTGTTSEGNPYTFVGDGSGLTNLQISGAEGGTVTSIGAGTGLTVAEGDTNPIIGSGTLKIDDTVITTGGGQTISGELTVQTLQVTTGDSNTESINAPGIIKGGFFEGDGSGLTGIAGSGGTVTDIRALQDGGIVTSPATTDGGNAGGITTTGTLSLDDTVVRTSGPQTIGGAKDFTTKGDFQAGLDITGDVGGTSAVYYGDGSNLSGVSNNAGTVTSVTAGDGILKGAQSGATNADSIIDTGTLSVDNTVVRTTGAQSIGGTKTFSAAPTLTAGATINNDLVFADTEITVGNAKTKYIGDGSNLSGIKAGMFSFKGNTSVLGEAPAAEPGDVFQNTTAGVATSTWVGIFGLPVAENQLVIYGLGGDGVNAWVRGAIADTGQFLSTALGGTVSGDTVFESNLQVGGTLTAPIITGTASNATLATTATTATDCSRSVTAGNGLQGGGALTADVALAVKADGDTITVSADGIKVNAGSITAGGADTVDVNQINSDGFYYITAAASTGQQQLQSNTGIYINPSESAVYATKFEGSGLSLTGVVYNEGDQTITGIKTFNSFPQVPAGDGVDPALPQDVASKQYVDDMVIASGSGTVVSVGVITNGGLITSLENNGAITQSGSLGVDTSAVVMVDTTQNITGTKTFTVDTNFSSDIDVTGNVTANEYYGDGSNLTGVSNNQGTVQSLFPGSGISFGGGADITTTGTISVDTTVLRNSGAQTINAGGSLTVNGNITSVGGVFTGDGSGLSNLPIALGPFSFKGEVDVTTNTLPDPVANGDVYVNTVAGQATNSWTGIDGQTVVVDQIVVYQNTSGTPGWLLGSALDRGQFLPTSGGTVTGNSTFQKNLTVTENLTVTGTAAVTSTSTLTGLVTAVNGVTITGSGVFTGDLVGNVDATTITSATVTTTGDITCQSPGEFVGTLNGTAATADLADAVVVAAATDDVDYLLTFAQIGDKPVKVNSNLAFNPADNLLEVQAIISSTQNITTSGTVAATTLTGDGAGVDNVDALTCQKQVIAGAGMTGGGTLSANVTLNVAPGLGIDVEADAVKAKLKTDGGLGVDANGLFVDATQLPPSATISTTPPTGAAAGDLWWDSDDGQLYIYYTDDGSGFDGAGTVSSQWVSATPIASTMSAQISALQAQVNSLLSRVAALES